MTELAYILSPSYSGSTLLTFLLGAHPKIATIGELKGQALGNIDEYDCSCGIRIRKCPFWLEVTERAKQHGFSFDPGEFGTHFRMRSRALLDRALRARYRGGFLELVRGVALHTIPGASKLFKSTIERNRVMIDIIRETQKGSIFLDGSKDPIRLKYMHDSGHWDIKVIYMIRDGRGTSCSYMRHYDEKMSWAATEWRDTHLECDRLVSHMPKGITKTIHYEDLCASPDATLSSIIEFLGQDPALVECDLQTTQQHIIGNSMRLNATNDIRLDEKWKKALSEDDLRVFEEIGGSLNRHYGYE